jgi:hypothetical protein
VRRNLDKRIVNNTLDVIRFIPTIVSKRLTLYSDVKIIWNKVMIRIPAEAYWSKNAIRTTAFPSLDLDLSNFSDPLVFLINTDCIVTEIKTIKPKTNMSARGIELTRDSVNVLPNDLSIT